MVHLLEDFPLGIPCPCTLYKIPIACVLSAVNADEKLWLFLDLMLVANSSELPSGRK